MKRKIRRRKKNKKFIEEPEAPISINEQNKEETTIEKLKLIGYWIIGITVVLSIFSGFKYPWKWIDSLYETENERLEIVEDSWNEAYTPLIRWCAENTALDASLAAIGKKNIAFKDYMISIVGDEKKCLEDKEFRISLFNNPRIKVRENKSLNKWFNEIPKHVKKINFEIEDGSQYKKDEFTIITNLFYYLNSIVSLEDENFRLRDVRNQIMCGYKEHIGLADGRCWSRAMGIFSSDGNEFAKDEREYVFSINFLSKKDFILLSKGCYLGCKAKITYMEDLGKYNIRGIEIKRPILRTWALYSDKSSSRVNDYDSMIIKAQYLVNELEKKHPKPDWYSNVIIQ